jgi:hypothetical protein
VQWLPTRIDSANPDSYAGIVGHSDLKDEIYQEIANRLEHNGRTRTWTLFFGDLLNEENT